jgi:hypothetical protein
METTTLAQLVPLVIGSVAVLGNAGLPSKYKGLVAVLLGVGLSLSISGLTTTAGIAGVVAGLAASGLWVHSKAVFTPQEELASVEDKG